MWKNIEIEIRNFATILANTNESQTYHWNSCLGKQNSQKSGLKYLAVSSWKISENILIFSMKNRLGFRLYNKKKKEKSATWNYTDLFSHTSEF